MKKGLVILLAIVGAVDVVFTVAVPTLIVLLWINFFGWRGIYSYLFVLMAVIATLFRAIKIGIMPIPPKINGRRRRK